MSIECSQELDAPIITPTLTGQDAGEVSLRPKLLADYTGQEKAKGNLSVYIEAARRRGEPLVFNKTYRTVLEIMLHQTGNKVIHKRIDSRIISSSCQYQLTVTECITERLRHIVSCQIINNYLRTSLAL